MSVKELIRSEKGTVAIIVAASLLFMMGLAAIVVDGGQGFSERRQAQSGVDFASLAALQFASSCDTTCAIADAVDNGAAEAESVVAGNLPGRSLDWLACDDTATRPAEYIYVSSITDCISFTANLEKARVKLPDDQVGTSFGRVLGITSMTTGAVAEAIQKVESSASVIPLTLGGSSAEVCLYSNQAPQNVPPCDSPDNGNFGYLDIALYGNTELGTPSTCIDGTANKRISINMTYGSDHNMVKYNAGDPIVNDQSTCPNRSEDVNQLDVKTGSPKNGITDGLLFGNASSIDTQPVAVKPGRLTCDSTPANASVTCKNVRGISLDHTGLWHYLTPSACISAQSLETHVAMSQCLTNWNSATDGVIFDESIRDHPRFAAVPVFSSYPSNGTSASYTIVEFVPVWLETIYIDCTANACGTIHSPGEQHPTGPPPCTDPIAAGEWNCGWNDSGPTAIEALTAFRLDLDMLPDSIRKDWPSRTTARKFYLAK